MKKNIPRNIIFILFVGVFFGIGVENVTAQNTISGLVFDNNRKPVSNIDIELLDNFERLVKTTKTNGSGLYFFPNLRAGIYFVKVRVAGTNFQKSKERINLGESNRTIQTGNGSRTSGTEVKQQDIYLQIDPQRINKTSPRVIGVIFAQEVPTEAKKHYEEGLKNVKKNRPTDGIESFQKALQIFPDYFRALVELGEIYLSQKQYAAAENILKKATEVNEKSFTSFFNLAIAQNNQDKSEIAIKTLQKANEIDGTSINSHLLIGIIQRRSGRFNEAEISLLKAKTLSDNKEADVNWQLAELFYFDLKKLNEAAEELDNYINNLSKSERKNNPKKIKNVKKLIKKILSEAKQQT